MVDDAETARHRMAVEAPSEPLTISVVIRTFNSELYLREQLMSILNQDLLPDQIVVSDDGSDDSTLRIVRDIRDKHRHLGIQWTLLPPNRVGIDSNTYRALSACVCDLVVMCDHDDVCHPTRFRRLVSLFAGDRTLQFAHSDAVLIDSTGADLGSSLSETQGMSHWERESYELGRSFEVLVRRSLATGATVGFRRDLLNTAFPFPNEWHYDEWLAILAASSGHAAFLDAKLVSYRQHESNVWGAHRRGSIERLRLLLAPGNARNDRLVRRSLALVRRLHDQSERVLPGALELAEEKLRHEEARSAMPTNRVMRGIPVLREAATGSYTRLARGRKDILLDLVQPRSQAQ